VTGYVYHLDCFEKHLIGRAFARPVGTDMRPYRFSAGFFAKYHAFWTGATALKYDHHSNRPAPRSADRI
jgi:hypothetical protein